MDVAALLLNRAPVCLVVLLTVLLHARLRYLNHKFLV